MQPPADDAARRAWLALLAGATASELGRLLGPLSLPPLQVLRAPELGLVMLRGRMGGTGAPFNLGEATVTRCAMTDGDVIGHGHVLGRDPVKAKLVASADAWLQLAACRPVLQRELLAPLEAAQRRELAAVAARTAATRVEFSTLARGDG